MMAAARFFGKNSERGEFGDFNSDFFNKYATTTHYLSRGASGNVYGPIEWKETQLAIKQIFFADGKVTGEFKKDIEEKQQIWTSLEYKNLTRIYSVDLSQLPKVMFIVMEFAAGGSLHKTLRSLGSENKLKMNIVADWAKQIAEGMLYLHEKNIVHRDLKSSNILLMEPFDARDLQQMISLKITDFDEVREHDQTTTMSFVGTYAYMAPEVLQNQWYSKASDVWSYGVVVWEMLSGDIPHKDLQSQEIIHKSMCGELDNLPIQQSFPESYQLLLKRCCMSDYKERPSFHDICLSIEYPMRCCMSDYKERPSFHDICLSIEYPMSWHGGPARASTVVSTPKIVRHELSSKEPYESEKEPVPIYPFSAPKYSLNTLPKSWQKPIPSRSSLKPPIPPKPSLTDSAMRLAVSIPTAAKTTKKTVNYIRRRDEWVTFQSRLKVLEAHLKTDIAIRVTSVFQFCSNKSEESQKMCLRILLQDCNLESK